ncbi:3-methyl-2-oxobutanoate hydroxymethyltransferase [Psychrobacter urativorans]|uniref:3-methyl-2-oxobutanoate hydroxymethyltransferase n=1 Tax=Psychrobacter urativorans TaxID=45610 RepID=A0A0M4T7W4_9GAMM|nr:3-methyl-2-oxobutanoate hydroxymethyltransferase [Psychrobacter urativorans]ALF59821.1 3-methyl-2-oxobutanoate hydroxymethyltransferase [Psychrobacter urativorans]
MTTLATLNKFKKDGVKFTCLTCYDAMFARMMDKALIDTILIGDSLGMVVQGHTSTLPVTVNDMAYHTANVARSNQHALIIADLPFMSYVTLPEAIVNSRQLMQAGAHVIKLEGGSELCELVTILAQAGTPTCVHLGLTPQSVNVFGGYKIQGRGDSAAAKLLADAQAVVAAGAALLVLECVPAELAKAVTETVDVPVIGIGAGADTDGQVLVMHDMLGMAHGRVPRFVHDFLTDERNTTHSIEGAFALYQQSVRGGSFPTEQHQFS